jgi:succinoglycan biosynthesis transport protein ExoP
MVRDLPQTEGTSGVVQIEVDPESPECEAFRTLRTTLAFSADQLERIAVTSSEPGDGKTTVIANLATAYAQVGKRTLLIDADLRRPGLTKLFEMRDRHGLSDVLKTDDDVADTCAVCIHASGVDNLDIIPSGPRPSNPAELLSRPRLEQLIAWADSQYDQVLIDCPPVLAASDAAIVGRSVDGVVLVLQPEKSHRRAIMRAVDGLATMKINLLGIVVNRIGGESGNYYGYDGGYGYAYGTEEDEYVDEVVYDQPMDANTVIRRRAA